MKKFNYFEKLGPLVLFVCLFILSIDLNADCTLTTQQGADGRCFKVTQNGIEQYKCLPREEDTHCFVDKDETIDP